MLAFWGDWKTARALVMRFGRLRYMRDRLVWLGYLTANPLSPIAGSILRWVTRFAPGPTSIGSASWESNGDAGSSTADEALFRYGR